MKQVLATVQEWLTKWGLLLVVLMFTVVVIFSAYTATTAHEDACTAVKRDNAALEKFLSREITKNSNGKPIDSSTKAFLSDLHDTHVETQQQC